MSKGGEKKEKAKEISVVLQLKQIGRYFRLRGLYQN